MKKILLALILQACALSAECCPEWSLAAKAAAVFPVSSKVRKIYGSSMPGFTLEANRRLSDCLSLWIDGSYIFKNGHSYKYGHHGTHLDVVPITVGVKYARPIFECADVYLGAGVAYAFLHTNDHSEFVHRKTSDSHFGAILKSGIIVQKSACVSYELFFNYSYQTFNVGDDEENDPLVYRHNVNFSSLQVGLGIGYKF